MNDEVKTIRNNIVKKFCRTILWIDDEIHLDTGFLAESLFREKYDEFTKSGLLCHLMEFPEARNSSDPYASPIEEILQSCVSLALQSDIVIVDWMLGSTDSSGYAENIIKQVVGKDKGFRFIVVLSNKEPKEYAFKHIDNSFELLKDNFWKNESGQFLLSLRKDEFSDENLFEKICLALSTAYPDYLHLAALEIAGRIKDLAPQWLSLLPTKTDMGILVERADLMQSDSTKKTWRDDIQECIAANLLEDLTAIIMNNPLKSLAEETLLPSNAATDSLGKLLNCMDSQVERVKPVFAETPPKNLTECFKIKTYTDFFNKIQNEPYFSELCTEIKAYTEFCDVKSIFDTKITPFVPGKIYQHMFADSEDIAVCISAACDCARASSEYNVKSDKPCHSLLFLRGEKMSNTDFDKISKSGGTTVLRFKDNSYLFKHDANSIMVKPCIDIKSPITSVGVFRHDILNRLISRYMSYMQRVGVNQPSLSRTLRGEK